ncbi:hypothetical protein BDZ97DRAFT_1852061 [Flammula alnicola]|nr:hypothetical protein BDZ97DRAFT_1852061 [Flammula alnicola]
MGFSVQQAKKALAATSNGIDVQAALESLLGDGGGSNRITTAEGAERERPHDNELQRPRESPPPPSHPARVRGAPKGQKERERERKERELERLRREGEGSTSSGAVVSDIQEHADKLLLQASEIGLSVFSKASAFWKEGKEKVVKAYEERAASTGPVDGFASGSRRGARGGASGPRMDGRPKWMQESLHISDEEEVGFKDLHSPALESTTQESRVDVYIQEEVHEVDLFSDAIPSTQTPASSTPNIRQSSTSSFSNRPTPTSTLPINRARPRDLPTASPAAITQALKHKSAGTEQFKLGQYGSAAELYSLAISAMPDGHLLLVPLYTNRALARLKTGEYVAAGEDCTKALGGVIVGGSSASSEADSFGLAGSVSDGPRTTVWSPAIEPKEVISSGQSKANEAGWAHPQGLGVDLCDGYVKALRRRTEAWEGREKWSEAGKDWEFLAGSGAGAQWVAEGVRREAVRGAGRCRRMVDGATTVAGSAVSVSSASTPNQASKPISRPKPKPKPVVSDPTPSQALRALRSSNAQAEADNILKHSLKDSVDARLNAWRTGKETNIHALLASLDVVLWEEILRGGVKVNGLGDLLTPAQVKKGYVRAIGKVHPDKLNASNSTVEQCMLANGVFGTLNEAWIAFQAGQK